MGYERSVFNQVAEFKLRRGALKRELQSGLRESQLLGVVSNLQSALILDSTLRYGHEFDLVRSDVGTLALFAWWNNRIDTNGREMGYREQCIGEERYDAYSLPFMSFENLKPEKQLIRWSNNFGVVREYGPDLTLVQRFARGFRSRHNEEERRGAIARFYTGILLSQRGYGDRSLSYDQLLVLDYIHSRAHEMYIFKYLPYLRRSDLRGFGYYSTSSSGAKQTFRIRANELDDRRKLVYNGLGHLAIEAWTRFLESGHITHAQEAIAENVIADFKSRLRSRMGMGISPHPHTIDFAQAI